MIEMQNSTLFSDNRKIYRLLLYLDGNIKDGRENLDCFYEIVAEQFLQTTCILFHAISVSYFKFIFNLTQ